MDSFYSLFLDWRGSVIVLVVLFFGIIGLTAVWTDTRRNPKRAREMKQLAEKFGLQYLERNKTGGIWLYPYRENIISGSCYGHSVLIFDEFSSTIENSLLSFVIGRLLPIKKKSEVVIDNSVVTSVTGSFGRWGRTSQELTVEDIQTLLERLKKPS